MKEDAPRVIKIPAKPEATRQAEARRQLRVAAYCRVSTKEEDQANSYEVQKEYYTDKIMSNTAWTMAGIFADKGITGTSAKKREDFMRMIRHCRQKKIDVILTKSVSRFSRNTVDCLYYIRALKQLGIAVIFEKENINSLEEDSELRITLSGAFAQSESESISANVTWGKRRAMEAGKVSIQYKKLYGYRKGEDGQPEIIPEQAEIVRWLYERYLTGASLRMIKDELEQQGVKCFEDSPEWNISRIRSILQNEKYCGDLIQKKTYTPDYLTHEKKYNHGKEPLVELKDHHEPIIDRETWQAVQRELSRRNRATGCGGHGNRYPLSGKIRCGECGKSFSHRTKKRQDGSSYYRWCCFTATNEGLRRTDGAGNTIGCSVGRQIRDDVAMDLLRRSVSAVTLDKKSIISSLTRVVESVLTSGEDSGEQELRRLELEFEKLQARNDTIHDRFFDESITKADYQRAKARCESEMNRVQEKIAAIKQRQALNTDTQTLKPDIRAAITGIVSGRTADDDFYGHLLQQMTVYRDGRVEVALNLLPAKWVYVLDGLEKYRAKIGGHDASSVPMSVSRPLSSG